MDEFEKFLNEVKSKGYHLECGFGCEFLGYTCSRNPEANPCPCSVVVDADGNEIVTGN